MNTVVVTDPRVSGGQERLQRLIEMQAASRLAAGDSTLWGPDAEAEASIRLGWVSRPEQMLSLVDDIVSLRHHLTQQGVSRVVLCGMGGSSLAPEVMARAHGVALDVVDSTHPDHVRELSTGDLQDTVVVVSSKSGTTVETATAKALFEAAFRDNGIDPTDRMVIVTDPDSPLHHEARSAGYRVFLGDPMVGGRYSALTAFGLVPATLAGVDTAAVLSEATALHESLSVDTADNPASILAAALADLAHDKVLLPDTSSLPGFGDWVEQLVAESTGKLGRGVLPVVTGSTPPDATLPDTILVSSTPAADVRVEHTLGGGFVLWEWATALAGILLGINPFDQPDVESAKKAARALLEDLPERPEPTQSEGLSFWVSGVEGAPGTLSEAIAAVYGHIGESGYLALQMYTNRLQTELGSLRDDLAASCRRPVTVGYGPRFLHSTGQFHKGGPATGVFIQVEVVAEADLEIPGYPFSYQQLIDAQAWGDRSVLVERGRPVLTIRVTSHEDLTRVLPLLRG